MIDKIVYGNAINASYVNEYRIKENYIEIHIYGGKYEAYVKIDKEDYLFACSYYWSLMAVGREGSKRLSVATSINRKSVNMGRVMLSINDENLRVEHKDRDCLNFRRENLYVIDKKDLKKQKPITGEQEILGVNPRYQNGKLTGYTVDHKQNNKKHTKYFGKREYGDIVNAKKEAINFRRDLYKIVNL